MSRKIIIETLELLLLVYELSFFCQLDGDQRDLPSFPTRRSSDLSGSAKAATLRAVATDGHRLAQVDMPLPKRSEEHTSELQSHSDLVCRLLLEKKKEISEESKNYLDTTGDTTAC